MNGDTLMKANEWVDSLSNEQRAELSKMDDDKVMDYLANEGVELPDDVLDGVAGGLPIGKLVANWLRGKLGF